MYRLNKLIMLMLSSSVLAACGSPFAEEAQTSVMVSDHSEITHYASDGNSDTDLYEQTPEKNVEDHSTDGIETSKIKKETAEQPSMIENSIYSVERSSTLIAEEFAADTQKDLTEVSDEEIAVWKESQSNLATSTSEATPEKVNLYDRLLANLAGSPEEYDFIMIDQGEGTYQVEIRRDQEVSEGVISNLVALLRYDSNQDVLSKMDIITGEYVPFSFESLQGE